MVNVEVRQARDPVYGWVMVGVVFLLTALSFGGLGSVGIFLKPMIAEFGWSRSETAMGYTSLSIAAAIMGIVWGFVADRWGCRAVAFPIVHIVPLVSDRGIPPETAASVLMVLMLAGILGRILGGVLGDRLGALPAFMVLSFAQTVLVLWFPFVESLQGTYILSIAFGIAYSGDMAIIIMCMRTMVPAAMAGRALGIGGFFGMLGMGLGSYQGGVLYDLTGDYQWSYTSAALAGVMNLIILSRFLARRNRLLAAPMAA
ncbi:MAG: MFS transporter [Alphaproteobacteria bacterium]